MNCEQCLYRTEEWRDGGHCYMFKDKPRSCRQFKTLQDTAGIEHSHHPETLPFAIAQIITLALSTTKGHPNAPHQQNPRRK